MKLVGAVLSIFLSCVCGATSGVVKKPFSAYKPELVSLFQQADQQREWLVATISRGDVDLKSLSLDQVHKTKSQLEAYKERMIEDKTRGGVWSDEQERCLMLSQELIRQLTNAELSFDTRVQRKKTVRKYVIPAGTAVSVFGGLMLLSLLTPLDISWSRAFLCGIAAGVAVGVITHKQEMISVVHDMTGSVKHFLTEDLSLMGKTAAAVSAAALMAGFAWHKKDAVFKRLR